MTYPLDLRGWAGVAAIDDGQAAAVIVRRFGVSSPTVRVWRDRAAAGDVMPGTPGPKAPARLSPAAAQLMGEQVAGNPGMTALQLLPMLRGRVYDLPPAQEAEAVTLQKPLIASEQGC